MAPSPVTFGIPILGGDIHELKVREPVSADRTTAEYCFPTPFLCVDDSPDGICSNGLEGVENVTIGVCCDGDCDICGDTGCIESVDCCASTIEASGSLCSVTGEAPCIVDGDDLIRGCYFAAGFELRVVRYFGGTL